MTTRIVRTGVSSGNVMRGAIVGLVGGLLAAGAMSVVHRILSDLDPKAEAPSPKPEDPTVQVARAATGLAGYPLAERQKPSAGAVVHYAFGAVVGAVYGAVAEIAPMVTTAFGVPFGIGVWLGAHIVAVPAMGLSDPPTRQPVGKETEEFGLHVVYGAVTEIVRRKLWRSLDGSCSVWSSESSRSS
jgi:putative membrane protein